jgi:CRP-like cAMP-binding protein
MQWDSEKLRQLVPLSTLDKKSLNYVLYNSKVLTLQKFDTLFSIGDTAPYSYYLMRGDLQLQTKDGEVSYLNAQSNDARYAVGNLIPRQIRASVASLDAVVAQIERDLLERELLLSHLYNDGGNDLLNSFHTDPSDWAWIMSLLHTPLFSRLPLSNLLELIAKLEKIPVTSGQTIIRQGEQGDYFYVVRKGTARVIRRADGIEVVLGRFKELQGFGEEALVADQPRRASVVMESDGFLMRLSKGDFRTLMEEPVIQCIALEDAQSLLEANKARLIDVRSEEEFAAGHLPGALNIPMYLLYLKSHTFSRDRVRILIGSTEAQARAAALLLTKDGYSACVLMPEGSCD